MLRKKREKPPAPISRNKGSQSLSSGIHIHHLSGGVPESNNIIYNHNGNEGKSPKEKVFIKYNTTGGPVKDSETGYFYWVVKFFTNGKDGWIVQKMENTYDETLADGSKNTTNVPTAKYWEAWKVGGDSSISPSINGNHDYWQRGYTNNRASDGTKGSWSIKGTAYFTQKDITKKGFATGNVFDAKTLIATTSNPGYLGKKLLIREKRGSWDDTSN